MAFHEVRFPAKLSFGSTGGPERRTEIVTLANGFEERNAPWAQSRRRYDAGVSLRSLDDIEELIAFFEARHGQLNAFRWKDWSDFKSCRASRTLTFEDQDIGIGDGQTLSFQLKKAYSSGQQVEIRPILKPVAGTVLVGVQGDLQVETLHYTLDATSGLVLFNSPPAVGTRVTAGFEFDVPVRFDVDRILVSIASFQAGDIPSVPVVEVRM